LAGRQSIIARCRVRYPMQRIFADFCNWLFRF
jgi:hypothetical protein